MKKGRTHTNIPVTSPSIAKEVIEAWLEAYQFTEVSHKGEKVYRSGDGVVKAYRYFTYVLDENALDLYAWTRGLAGELPLDSKRSAHNASYGDHFSELLASLSKKGALHSGKHGEAQNSAARALKEFQASAIRRDETITMMALIMAMISFLLSFLDGGIFAGVLLYVLIFVFAMRGFRTPKRYFAIAAIVLGSIALALMLAKVI